MQLLFRRQTFYSRSRRPDFAENDALETGGREREARAQRP